MTDYNFRKEYRAPVVTAKGTATRLGRMLGAFGIFVAGSAVVMVLALAFSG